MDDNTLRCVPTKKEREERIQTLRTQKFTEIDEGLCSVLDAVLDDYERLANAQPVSAEPVAWFPMQGGPPIPWPLAELIYAKYAEQYGKSQSLKRLADRGGFGWAEVESIMDRTRRYRHDRQTKMPALYTTPQPVATGVAVSRDGTATTDKRYVDEPKGGPLEPAYEQVARELGPRYGLRVSDQSSSESTPGEWVFAAAAEMRPYVEKMPEVAVGGISPKRDRTHLLHMIDKMADRANFGDVYKAHRWLGWLQCAAVSARVITFEECAALCRRYVKPPSSGS